MKNLRFIRRFTAVLLVLTMITQVSYTQFLAGIFKMNAYAAPSAQPYAEPVDLPNAMDLTFEDETALSPAIRSLADGLSVVGVYEFVRNNINSEFYYGAYKGAIDTFDSKSGNDYDISALLIGMLRYKGIEARYCKGIVSLSVTQAKSFTGTDTPDAAAQALAAKGIPTTIVTSQGKIAAIRIERIWTEAYIPYDNYRGAGEGGGKKTWIPLDAGFKFTDASGAIIPEELEILPASLPYVIVTNMEKFSSTEGQFDNTFPDITYDIPFRMALGESYGCSVNATDDTGVKSLEVALNGQPVALSAFNTFDFTATDYGSYVFVIKASDEAGNTRTITHTLLVEQDADITPPEQEVTVDVGEGVVGSPVTVHVTASDDSGTVFVDVKVNDDKIDGENDVYIFTPDELGVYKIVVTATDSGGNYTQKTITYTLTGSGGESDTTSPELDVQVDIGDDPGPGEPIYIYVTASDDSGDVTVVTTVDGEEIDGDGTYTFVPERYGTFEILVTATNPSGNTAQRTIIFTLTEGGGAVDITPPELDFTIETNGSVSIGKPIEIHVTASDDSGTIFVDVKVNDESLIGEDDVYVFTPDKAGKYEIVVTATDSSGSYTQKTTTMTITAGGGGVIDTTAPEFTASFVNRDIYVGEVLSINIDIGENSDEVSIEATANGETLPYEEGVVRFTPLEPGSYDIVIVGTNPSGNSSVVRFTLTAIVNTEQSQMYIIVNGGWDSADVGDDVPILVGGVGIASDSPVVLTVNGDKLALNKFNEATFVPQKAGLYDIQASAKDIQGNELTASTVLKVFDSVNAEIPDVKITSLAEGAEISAPTDISGTVTQNGLAYYTLSYAEAGSTDFTVFAQGDEAADNEVLGTFDPTMLNNGYYTIRLTGYCATGGSIEETTVLVQGNMKIGNYSIAFRDMDIPVMNFPLTVVRGYDSRDKQKSGDFGYGWNLSMTGATLSESCAPGSYWSQRQVDMSFEPYFEAYKYIFVEDKTHEVSIDWGNGKVDKFSMKLSPDQQSLMPIRYDISVSYVPKGNTKSKLEALGTTKGLYFDGSGLYDLNTLKPYSPSRYRLTTEDKTVYIFNNKTGVESITDTLGNTITFNKNGVHHSDGKSIAFVRDGKNRITKIVGPTGKEVLYDYDTKGDLVAFRDISGEITKFEYDNKHFLTNIIDPRGVKVARNEYDGNGRLIATVDASGNRMEFSHDIDGRREAITDRLGNVTQYVYDNRGNIVSLTDALGNTTLNTYDANGNLKTKTDALGNVTQYVYSPDGRLLSMTNALGIKIENEYNQKSELITVNAFGVQQANFSYNSFGQTTQMADALGNATNYEYLDDGRLKSISDNIGLVMQFTYDSKGNVVSATNGANDTSTFTYDDDGNALSKTITRKNENGVNETLTENYQYDRTGNVSKTIYPDGTFISFEYDGIGNIESITDSVGRRTTLDYDIFGNLTKVNYFDNTFETFEYDVENRNTKATDRYGQVITMTYDAIGNLKTKTYTNGAAESYEYDKKYRIVSKTDTAGAETVYEYDEIDRNTAITDALGNRTEFSYNSLSQLSEVKDPKGHVTKFEYDLNGNRTKVILPGGNSISAAYDARGRLIRQTDQNGYTTQYKYDGLDRLIGVIDPLNSEWRYAYNSVGELISVTDPNGNKTSYKYDDRARLIKTINAAGQESTNVYDDKGNLVSSVNFAGITTVYKYDDSDRVTQILAGTKTITITYNANNQIDTVTDENGVTKYTYNNVNLMTSEQKPDGRTLSYEYDAAGRLTKLITPYGSTSYTYDILSRLKTVTDKDGAVTTYEYDPNGNLITVSYSNGMVTRYGYNSVNALISEKITDKNGAVVREYAYTVGKAGERLKVTESNNRTVDYEYDKLYRLTKETVTENLAAKTTTYTFDAVSNRISKNEDGVSTIYTYNNLNQLIAETGITYEYDLNGNRIKKIEGLRTTTYTFNELNRLIRATVQEGQNVAVEEYKYDWKGNRIEKSRELEKIKYLVDTNNWIAHVVAETDGTGALKAFYTRGNDVLINMDQEGVKSYYLYDGHGSVRMLANENNFITDTYNYNAYGEITFRTGVTDNDYLYAGEQFDKMTELYYLRARYMDPSTGTFISMDTYQGNMSDPVSLHKYIYANANPVMNIDPTGMFSLAEMGASMNIQGILDSMSTLNYIRIYNQLMSVLKVVNLALALKDLYTAIMTGDPKEILLAFANGVVAIAAFLDICALSQISQILTKVLAVISLGDNAQKLYEAIMDGDIWGAIEAGIGIVIAIVDLSSSCFTGDTLVAMEDGYKRIDEIEVGDYVWAYNVETGDEELKEVKQVFVKQTDEIMHLQTTVGNIDTTTNHPFYVVDKGWVAAGNLQVGDKVYTINGDSGFVTALDIEKLVEPIVVYNLEVDDFHTYFLGKGILVHNKCGGTEEHHIASDKSIKSGYTDKYNELFERGGMKLSDPENIVTLSNHSGRHTNAYKDYVLEYIESMMGSKTGADANNALSQALTQLKDLLKNDILDPYMRY